MSEKGIIEEIVERMRERIREITPGEVPAMRRRHPAIGLIHDIQRLIRRKVRRFLYQR